MAKENIKNLTSAELVKQRAKLDKKVEFKVEVNGQIYKLQHDEIFVKTKQNQLLEDVVEFFSHGTENIKLLEMATPYTALLVLKHFTTLEVSDDIGEALELLNVLIDLELLDKLIDALPEDQTKEVFELFSKTVENMSESLKDSELQIEQGE